MTVVVVLSSQEMGWAWQNCWDAAHTGRRPRPCLSLECVWMCFPSEWADLPSFQVKCKCQVASQPHNYSLRIQRLICPFLAESSCHTGGHEHNGLASPALPISKNGIAASYKLCHVR